MAILFNIGSFINNKCYPLLRMQDSKKSSTELHIIVSFHNSPDLYGCWTLHISEPIGYSYLWCLNGLHLYWSYFADLICKF